MSDAPSPDRKILIIAEEASATLELLTPPLHQAGFSLAVAFTGAEASRRIRQSPPDLILLKVNLPDCNGYDLCRQLKANRATYDIPVIFILDNPGQNQETEAKLKAFASGGVDYVTPPFQPEELLLRLEMRLAGYQARRKLQQQLSQLQKENTQRRRVVEALQESRERYRLLAEHSTDMISRQNPQGVYLYVSPACRLLLGYELEEMISRSVFEFIHPDDRPPIEASYHNLGHQPLISTMTYRAHHKAGHYIWLETTNKIVHSAQHVEAVEEIIAVSRDVTERKQTEEALEEAYDELDRRIDELSTLNILTQTLATVTDLQTTLEIIVEAMSRIFHAEHCSIALRGGSQDKMIIVAEHAPLHNDKSSTVGAVIPLTGASPARQMIDGGRSILMALDAANDLTGPLHTLAEACSAQYLILVPLITRGEIIGAISAFSAHMARELTPTEIGLAETIAGQTAGAIENARLFSEQQQAKEEAEAANIALSRANQHLKDLNHRMQDELALAHEIQQGLLPPSHPNWPDLDIVCYSVPAREVGGDFYRYHAFSETSFACAVGDVSGKGVSAALLMASSLAQFDATLLQKCTPRERMAYLDGAIARYAKPRRQNCALCYVEFEAQPPGLKPPKKQDLPPSFMLHIVNAGCIPPCIRRKNGEVEWPDVGGFALGQELGVIMGYLQVTLPLRPGDMVILSSDGAVEAKNKAGQMFGFERLEQTVAAGPTASAAKMMAHLRAALEEFVGPAELHDDLTIMVALVKE
jgi:PAS domain S-box-containing protein